jgi:ribosomal protein S12 methylthiotransferase
MKFFFDALGCPKALVDAERMCYYLEKDSHTLTFNPYDADAIIINTCGFIEQAKKENIEAILSYIQMKEKKPNLKIILTGCLTERYKAELLKSLPEIDNAIGVRDLTKVSEALARESTSVLLDEGDYKDSHFTDQRTLAFSGLNYAYLKIAEGCSRSCSFCAIPGIRGTHRSRKMEDILKEADFLLEHSMKELILISEDTISYGMDLYREKSLVTLLKKLVKTGIDWIRIMYLFPEEEIYEIASFIKENKSVCDYIDIPFQHASDPVIKSMKRPGGYDYYIRMLEKIRKIHPGLHIRTSFIAGYPGETVKDFEVLKDFIREARFDRVGCFSYSSEEGTAAGAMKEKAGKRETNRRIKELLGIQEDISREKLEAWIGKEVTAINDGIIKRMENQNYLTLRSQYDAPEIDGVIYMENKGESVPASPFLKVRIDRVWDNHDLIGKRTD